MKRTTVMEGYNPMDNKQTEEEILQVRAGELEDIVEEYDEKLEEEINKLDSEGRDTQQEQSGKIMFDMIAETIIHVMTDENTGKVFAALSEKLAKLGNLSTDRMIAGGPADISKELCELVSTSVTYAVWAAIGYYDNDLKTTLGLDFQSIAEVIQGIDQRVLVTEMKVADLENKIKLDEHASQINSD
jgi:hypothetical protein